MTRRPRLNGRVQLAQSRRSLAATYVNCCYQMPGSASDTLLLGHGADLCAHRLPPSSLAAQRVLFTFSPGTFLQIVLTGNACLASLHALSAIYKSNIQPKLS